MRLYTHLNFGGNCEEAFRFYEKHLGGTVTMMMKGNELPPGTLQPDCSPNAVVHARMNVAGVELMGNDVPSKAFQPVRSSTCTLRSTPRKRPTRSMRSWRREAR